MLTRLREWLFHLSGSDRPTRILIFGDSHTVAISQALAYREPGTEPILPKIELHRLLKLKNGRDLGDTSLEQFCRKISRLRETDCVFSVIGGNQYAVASTVRARPYFDVLANGNIGELANSDDTIIPHRALESYIQSGVFNSDGPVLKEIRAATKARVFHLTPPPPKEDNSFLSRYHESRFAAEGLGELEPHSPQLRMTCWKMQRDSLSAFCTEIGVELVPPPCHDSLRNRVSGTALLWKGCYSRK